ncbi:hypothetical protein BAL199_19783 [alpha proteobacterium BAL199]|nr:hypothetical protein BAL199_19783 [alpha proteobacterium BAL199]
MATGPNAAARRLQARVARIGGPEAPELTAVLERAVYRPGDALRVRASVARGRAFLAVYVWQADGGVVRIAPLDGRTPVTVEAGVRVDLPGPDDAEVTAAAMSGVLESLEAVVVVASAVPFAPDRLAPLLEQSPDASLHAAASSGAFLDRVSSGGNQTDETRASANAWRKSADPDGLTRLIFTTSLDRSRISLAILPYRAGSGE